MPVDELQCFDRATGTYNLYQLVELGPDLFGQISLLHYSGPYGSEGRCRSVSFATERTATAARTATIAHRRAAGFREPQRMGMSWGDPAALADRLETAILTRQVTVPETLAHAVERYGTLARMGRHRASSPEAQDQCRILWPVDDVTYRMQAEFAVIEREAQAIPEIARLLTSYRAETVRLPGAETTAAVISGQAYRLVPRSRRPALDRDVIAALAPDPALRGLSLRCYRAGIVVLGLLVQLDFNDVLDLTQSNRALVTRVEQRLAVFGLALFSKVTNWKPHWSVLYNTARRSATRSSQPLRPRHLSYSPV